MVGGPARPIAHESISIQRKRIVFRHPNSAGIHVDAWKNVIVERPFVRTIQATGNHDVWADPGLEPKSPRKRTAMGLKRPRKNDGCADSKDRASTMDAVNSLLIDSSWLTGSQITD